MEAFTLTAPGNELSLSNRPLLCLSYDECSANLALYVYLYYFARLRVLALRDIFHREWNDTKLALMASGVWWVVLLTTLAYNFVHGPWANAAWFGKLVEGCQDFVAKSPHGSPLFEEFYERICADLGKPPRGSSNK